MGNVTEKAKTSKGTQILRNTEREKKNPLSWRGHGKISFRFDPETKRWFLLIALAVLVSLLLFPTILTSPEDYELGDVAKRDIKAPSELLIENPELTQKRREKAVEEVLPVYDFDPLAEGIVQDIRDAFKAGRTYSSEASSVEDFGNSRGGPDSGHMKEGTAASEEFKRRFFTTLGMEADEKTFEVFMRTGFSPDAQKEIISLVQQPLRKGVVSNKTMLLKNRDKGILLHDIHSEKETEISDLGRFYSLQEAKAAIRKKARSVADTLGSREVAEACVRVASALIQPNITFNNRETQLRMEQARESVKPFYSKVKKGEMLVREGERIKSEHLLRLSALQKRMGDKKNLAQIPAMAVLVGFLLAALYLLGLLAKGRSETDTKNLVFGLTVLFVTFLMVLVSDFVAKEIARELPYFGPRGLLFAIPVAAGAMLIAIFQGLYVAAGFSIVVSLLASFVFGGSMELFVYFLVGCLIAAFGVRVCRERSIFIKAGVGVGLANIALALAVETLNGSFYSVEPLVAGICAFVGGILVGVITTGILPLVEMSFDYTTDIKLLELANLDQPLLRELMVRAPGTYHHSVIVSNMVEATAKEVHANPLLAKVAAYYHDIGKMNKPLYFVENQVRTQNKHEKLAPSMSALILISHVKEGVEMAKKNKLGKEITDIISQHHGTSLISFFYQKALEQTEKKGGKSPKIKEEDFRYPGPKPQTKEAGLVMLADAVEAASRSISEPNAARIQGMVQKIIRRMFSDGQLDECELTLKDLHKIAKGFNKTLSGIFHHRIDYPEQAGKPETQRKSANGYTAQLSVADSGSKQGPDKGEAEDNLKRLGIS